ncbi:hypothetical protein EJ03DRAFT_327062 [Teratosphaeria nubilosa]|uniref:Secreted protein n=1 Tax=Teratosphaeria nubilosa TaxID=161662 RepID=A0A6G1LBX0_9PEZI|nr:hypothetical protein EJ03DRAFT_327062 [Teratosphaeria nubilosa]
MPRPLSLLPLLSWLLHLTPPTTACAFYENCKCHGDVSGVQNDTVTKNACAIYEWGKGDYHDGPKDHHDCIIAGADGGIANCGWNLACQRFGAFHQVCWNHYGHASKNDGKDLPPEGWLPSSKE